VVRLVADHVFDTKSASSGACAPTGRDLAIPPQNHRRSPRAYREQFEARHLLAAIILTANMIWLNRGHAV
jgi:hypothetical protein